MKLTKRLRRKINRKMKSNWTQENLLMVAFRAQVEAQLTSRIRKAKSYEEVDMILKEFTIKPLKQSILNLSNSTFAKSGKEFELVVGAFIQNPRNKYLNLRAKNLLNNKEDYDRFMEAFRHNVSLIKDLPQDIALDMERVYKRGTAFRGTEFAKELAERLGKRARVIIRTESAKITSTLTQLRMQKIGLNAYIWSTSEDSRVRSSHSILDGVLFFWNDPPTIDNYQNHCGRFINCFGGETEIKTLYGINKVYRREYEGEVFDLTFDDGSTVTVTPNHPFVTPVGFRSVKELEEGDYVIGSRGFAHGNNVDDLVISFEQLFKFFAFMCAGHLEKELSNGFDFHNDGIVDKEVDIVSVDSFLRSDFISELCKFMSDFVFKESDVRVHGSVDLSFKGAGVEFVSGVLSAAQSLIGRFGELFELVLRCVLESDNVGLATSTLFDSVVVEQSHNNSTVDVEFFGKAENRLTFIKFINNFIRGEFALHRGDVEREWESETNKSILERVALASKDGSDLANRDSIDGVHFVRIVKKVRRVDSLFVHNIEHYTGIYQLSPAIFVGNCRCVPIPVASLDDIQFPIKVARGLNIQSHWVKGGKGKYETKIVDGAIITYTREQFIAEFGKQFS